MFMFFVILIFSSALCGKIQTSKDEIDLMKNPENDIGFFHTKSCWKQSCFGIETNTTFEIIRKSNGSTFIITRGVVTDTIGETHWIFDESFCSNDEICPMPKCPPNDCLNACTPGKISSFGSAKLWNYVSKHIVFGDKISFKTPDYYSLAIFVQSAISRKRIHQLLMKYY